LSSDIQILRRKLVQRWQNESRTRRVVNEHDGSFSVSDAIRCTISGESNYLVKKGKKTNNKPAVCVLADLSASMDGQNIHSQTEALIALSEACSLAGIPLNIIGFSSACIVAKKWSDPMPKSRGMLGGMNHTIGGTDLPRAVFEGIKSFNSRKETKKVLITLTDGQISSYDKRTIHNMIAMCENSGKDIDFYGLGIGLPLEDIFPKEGEVDSANIASSVLEILAA
jgi:hypothetical protein